MAMGPAKLTCVVCKRPPHVGITVVHHGKFAYIVKLFERIKYLVLLPTFLLYLIVGWFLVKVKLHQLFQPALYVSHSHTIMEFFNSVIYNQRKFPSGHVQAQAVYMVAQLVSCTLARLLTMQTIMLQVTVIKAAVSLVTRRA